MEEEIEIDPEIKNLDDPFSDEKLDTVPKIITNFEILKIIFSRKTAPHAVVLSIFLIVLGVLSQSSSQFLVNLILQATPPVKGAPLPLGSLVKEMVYSNVRRLSQTRQACSTSASKSLTKALQDFQGPLTQL